MQHLQNKEHIWIILVTLVILLAAPVVPNEYNPSTRARRNVIGDNKINATCIAHDAKFTCDCQNVNQPMLLPHLLGNVFQVEIRNCKVLTIDANALEDTQGLRKIIFNNIANLVLNRNSLTFPRYASNTPLIIEFQQVNFEIIESHAISGNIEEISFIGGRINVIHPFGFTTIKDRAILLKFDNVQINRIEPQAFKKFTVDQIEITNCVFTSNLPSKSFYELEALNTLIIHNVRFQEVHSRAFSFKFVSKFSITNNHFLGVDAEWIEAHVRESAVIRDNNFGAVSPIAFKGISVHRDYVASEMLELRFINNTVRLTTTPIRPLEFSERLRISIEQLHYANNYSCKDLDTSGKPPKPRGEFFQKYSDKILFLRGDANADNHSFLVLNKLIELDCKQPSYFLYIILGVIALVLILVIIVVVVWCRIARNKKRKKLNVVMPEPRTYKETQIVYQIENAGLLKTDL